MDPPNKAHLSIHCSWPSLCFHIRTPLHAKDTLMVPVFCMWRFHSLVLCQLMVVGEYKEDHEAIRMFWEVVEGFTEQEKQQLLKFVTSCSRPPLLGFKDLFPPFCVMSGGQDDRLPSASTCMNLLKLPIFPDFQTLQSRLKYALSSGAGFELS